MTGRAWLQYILSGEFFHQSRIRCVVIHGFQSGLILPSKSQLWCVMPGLVPGIQKNADWIAGTSPAMTHERKTALLAQRRE